MEREQENGVEPSCKLSNGEKNQQSAQKSQPSKVKRLSKRLSAYFSFVRIDEPNELTRSNPSVDSTVSFLEESKPRFYFGDLDMQRSRAMSESESLRRKYKEESTSIGNRASCGPEMKDFANVLLEERKNTHSSVRRVSSMPITSSTAQASPPPFDRLHLYEKLNQLGEGSYATVYKGISKVNKMFVALKEIRLQEDEGAPFTAIREASLLKQLKHHNIVRLHDIIHTNRNLTLVFEYLHTDLCQYLERHPDGLKGHNAKLFLFQLLRGLSYIHKRRILHRDLKPQNLLLSEQGDLKLADFGLARSKTVPSRTYSNEVVTLWYRPPDVLCGSKTYSTSLDVWGVGCIFLEMLTGLPIFPGTKGVEDQLDRIWKVCGSPDDDWFNSYKLFSKNDFHQYKSKELSHFVPRLRNIKGSEDIASKMIQCRPENRLSCDQAINHDYFSDLPKELHILPDSVSIFTIKGISMEKESERSRRKSDQDDSSKSYFL